MKASSCSSSSCPYSRLAWLRVILHGNICSYKAPSSVLVVSGRAGGGSQHQPSLMRRRERRGWWLKGEGGGGGGGCTVTNRFQGDPCSICPGRGERHGTSRQNPFKILIRSWLFCKSSSLSEIQINPERINTVASSIRRTFRPQSCDYFSKISTFLRNIC